MNLDREHSKQQQIAEALAQEIGAGTLAPGARLQSARQLAERFGASLSAITGAFGILEKRGLLIRKPRSGVFVALNRPMPGGMDNKVFLCMPSRGHFFHEVFTVLFGHLSRAGYVPLLIDSFQVLCDDPRPEIMRQLREVLASRPAAVVVFGSKYWQNPFLDDFPDLKRIFLLEIDHTLGGGDNAVLLDFEATNYRLTRHLIDQGCRRIACVFGPVPRHPEIAEARRLHHYELHFSGYERALREAGLAHAARFLAVHDHEITPAFLRRLLDAPDAPDALLCQLDHTAYLFASAARQLGVGVPERLKLTGIFNTPWSRNPLMPLTTAGFDMEFLAQQTIALLDRPGSANRIVYCRPKLHIRRSTDPDAPEAAPEFTPELAIMQN